MEKMSEVFELPVKCSGNYLDADIGVCCDMGEPQIAQHAAHAINHVDALYEALQLLFNDYKGLADSGDAGNWKLEETDVGMEAMAALAAYRGEA